MMQRSLETQLIVLTAVMMQLSLETKCKTIKDRNCTKSVDLHTYTARSVTACFIIKQ
jgi:hypothetical protein